MGVAGRRLLTWAKSIVSARVLGRSSAIGQRIGQRGAASVESYGGRPIYNVRSVGVWECSVTRQISVFLMPGINCTFDTHKAEPRQPH